MEGRVKAAYLFGGRFKGYTLKGDYDIAVLMPDDYSLYDLGLIQVDIAQALNIDEEKVDIICLNSASPRIVLDALNGIPIIKDPLRVVKLKMKAMEDLLDLEVSSRYIKRFGEASSNS